MRNYITEDVDEFRKVGAEMSYNQSQMHSDYDSAESIADSDLEDGELRKMLASPLKTRWRGEYFEMKRAQELRVDKISVQKIGEIHETIQKLTSQMPDMQEQMNSMNDSGECPEVESNHSG